MEKPDGLAQFWHFLRSNDTERIEQAPGKVETEAEMSGYRFPAYVVRDREGWAAHCPEFPDCRARGATYEEALDNLRDVIQIFVEDGLGDDEPPPQHAELSLTTLDF
jgi:predicted RNase H-like HicB family nuclease